MPTDDPRGMVKPKYLRDILAHAILSVAITVGSDRFMSDFLRDLKAEYTRRNLPW